MLSVAAEIIGLAGKLSPAVSLACAESCTGGLVASAITDVPGASAFFRGGIVAYSAEIKTSVLGVPAATIEKFGVVSEGCAREMVAGARRLFAAEFAVATTGVAGPGPQGEIPAGTVCIAASAPATTISRTLFFAGESRENVKLLATKAALEMLLGLLRETRMAGGCGNDC
ncbi:MAG: CinA family protein [Opitutae bacterium]|nr:CinA family protein [Opitutae bacterium]